MVSPTKLPAMTSGSYDPGCNPSIFEVVKALQSGRGPGLNPQVAARAIRAAALVNDASSDTYPGFGQPEEDGLGSGAPSRIAHRLQDRAAGADRVRMPRRPQTPPI